MYIRRFSATLLRSRGGGFVRSRCAAVRPLDGNLAVPDRPALDLNRRMADAEPPFDECDRPLQYVLALDAVLDEDVAAEGVESRGDRPDVRLFVAVAMSSGVCVTFVLVRMMVSFKLVRVAAVVMIAVPVTAMLMPAMLVPAMLMAAMLMTAMLVTAMLVTAVLMTAMLMIAMLVPAVLVTTMLMTATQLPIVSLIHGRPVHPSWPAAILMNIHSCYMACVRRVRCRTAAGPADKAIKAHSFCPRAE